MSDSIHYKGLILKALNLYCKSQDGTQVFQAYERPCKLDSLMTMGCSELCQAFNDGECYKILGYGSLRDVCTNNQILWRKLI